MPYADNEHLHQWGLALEVSINGTTWESVNDLVELDGYESERGKSDDFTLQTPQQIKRTTPGWQTLSDIAFTAFLHKVQLDTLYAYYTARTNPLYWRVTLPLLSNETTPTIWTFQGWIGKCKFHQMQSAGGEEKFKVNWTVVPNTAAVIVKGTTV